MGPRKYGTTRSKVRQIVTRGMAENLGQSTGGMASFRRATPSARQLELAEWVKSPEKKARFDDLGAPFGGKGGDLREISTINHSKPRTADPQTSFAAR